MSSVPSTAVRVFRGALAVNTCLTLLWLYSTVAGHGTIFFQNYAANRAALVRVLVAIGFFYVIWGLIWWGIKTLLLRYFVGFTKQECRDAFSSRMREPYDVQALVAKYSERRIRIADMIGRRGRFITLAAAGFFYLYFQISREQNAPFASAFLQDNLFDAIVTGWIFLGFYYANGLLAATFYGPQSRVMDGRLARANCLLITTLWSGFKFVMVPIGLRLAVVFTREEFAAVFAMIWGSYIAADACAEVFGALFGKQRIRVIGVGDVNRKSITGTVAAFLGALVLCLWVVAAQHLGGAWWALAVVIATSNAVLELYSPRGTDDFTMATTNALICLGFGYLMH